MTTRLDSLFDAWAAGRLGHAERDELTAWLAEDADALAAWREREVGLLAEVDALPELEDPHAAERLRASLSAALANANRFEDHVAFVAELIDQPEAVAAKLLAAIDDPASWEDGPAPWIQLYHFAGGPAVHGAITGFVRLDPGTPFPHHEHLGDEYVLVLQGELLDSDGSRYPAGALSALPPDTEHEIRAVGPIPCVYLAVVFGGVRVGDTVFSPDDPNM